MAAERNYSPTAGTETGMNDDPICSGMIHNRSTRTLPIRHESSPGKVRMIRGDMSMLDDQLDP